MRDRLFTVKPRAGSLTDAKQGLRYPSNSSSATFIPGRSTTKATPISPLAGHGIPTTAATPGQAVSQSLQPDLPYDVVEIFAPIAIVCRMPFSIVVPATSPYRTLADLVLAVKAQPVKLNFGSAGIGSLSQIVGEIFNRAAEANIVYVPYKGAAPQIERRVHGNPERGGCKDKFQEFAATPGASTPAELSDTIRRHRDEYAEIVKAAGIKAE